MCDSLFLNRTVLERKRIRKCSCNTAHQDSASCLPLTIVRQRKHCNTEAKVPDRSEGNEGKGW